MRDACVMDARVMRENGRSPCHHHREQSGLGGNPQHVEYGVQAEPEGAGSSAQLFSGLYAILLN